MAVILVLCLLRQEALKFQASLGDKVRFCPLKTLKNKNINKVQSAKESF